MYILHTYTYIPIYIYDTPVNPRNASSWLLLHDYPYGGFSNPMISPLFDICKQNGPNRKKNKNKHYSL